jgi:sporulation protein YlmC with PRC-barrel domain
VTNNDIGKEKVMKKVITIISVLMLMFAFTAAYAGGEKAHEMKEMSGTSVRASEIIGSDVENRQGEDLGEISDLAIDPQSGRVAFAILSSGGILGIGDKQIPVPMKALSFREDKVVINISKEKLEKAPSFEKDKWPDITDRTRYEKTYQYFGVRPHWEESEKGMELKEMKEYQKKEY